MQYGEFSSWVVNDVWLGCIHIGSSLEVTVLKLLFSRAEFYQWINHFNQDKNVIFFIHRLQLDIITSGVGPLSPKYPSQIAQLTSFHFLENAPKYIFFLGL